MNYLSNVPVSFIPRPPPNIPPPPNQPPPPPAPAYDPYNPFEDDDKIDYEQNNFNSKNSDSAVPVAPNQSITPKSLPQGIPLPPTFTNVPPPPPTDILFNNQQQHQIDIEKEKLLKIQKEKLEHDQLIQAENNKSKKLIVKPVSNFIKPKKIIGFDNDDDDGDEVVSSDSKTINKNSSMTGSSSSSLNDSAKKMTSKSENNSDIATNQLTPDQVTMITKTAAWVIDNPEKAQVLIEKSRGNEKMKFLYDRHSPAGKMYYEELSRYKAEKDVHDIFHGPAIPSVISNSATLGSSSSAAFLGNEEIQRLRANAVNLAQEALKKNQLEPSTGNALNINKNRTDTVTVTAESIKVEDSNTITNDNFKPNKTRKRRWDEPIAATTINTTVTVTSPTLTVPVNSFNVINSSLNTSDDKEKARWEAQIREQKELQLLESRIRQAASNSLHGYGSSSVTAGASREELLYQERLREYQELADRYDAEFKDTLADAEANGGVIEGGTWEHRKRAMEMLETAKKNLELTAAAMGRSNTHIGDYLPQTLLDQFLKKSEAIKKGEKINNEDNKLNYSENKLSSENLGYQMLAKAGWSEGESLGSNTNNPSANSRLIEPIAAKGQGIENVGIGVTSTHELTSNDDDFDTYRKRMMLAYRFRPNPMNNPRRDYY